MAPSEHSVASPWTTYHVSHKPVSIILSSGAGAWAFEEHAGRLSSVFGVPVLDRAQPLKLVYLLAWDRTDPPKCAGLFIPFEAVRIAGDKRLQAERFAAAGVATPRTLLLATAADVDGVIAAEPDTRWVLKYPTGCGASGHRLLAEGVALPTDWPRPYVVQEFIELEAPEVYRLYCAGGELFGWNARRFPAGTRPSPWVAHARGARYVTAGEAPAEARDEARKALAATGLLESFGCVDLLRANDGRWLVLEVGTDGVNNHVDRGLDLPELEAEIDGRLSRAFHAWATGRLPADDADGRG